MFKSFEWSYHTDRHQYYNDFSTRNDLYAEINEGGFRKPPSLFLFQRHPEALPRAEPLADDLPPVLRHGDLHPLRRTAHLDVERRAEGAHVAQVHAVPRRGQARRQGKRPEPRRTDSEHPFGQDAAVKAALGRR